MGFNSRGYPGYRELSGTSMAAPVAAGAAALLFSQDATLTPGDVKARLMKTATKRWRRDGTTPDLFSRGAGYLNIPAALACDDDVAGPSLSPTATVSSTGVILTVVLVALVLGDVALVRALLHRKRKPRP